MSIGTTQNGNWPIFTSSPELVWRGARSAVSSDPTPTPSPTPVPAPAATSDSESGGVDVLA